MTARRLRACGWPAVAIIGLAVAAVLPFPWSWIGLALSAVAIGTLAADRAPAECRGEQLDAQAELCGRLAGAINLQPRAEFGEAHALAVTAAYRRAEALVVDELGRLCENTRRRVACRAVLLADASTKAAS